MAKNRKKKTNGFVFPLPAAAVLLVTVVLLLMYVWLDAKGQALGARINLLEQQQAEIKKRYDNELWKWERIKSPANIERLLNQNRIAMIWPDERSIVRLSEPDLNSLGASSYDRQVAQMSSGARSVLHD